MSVHLSDIPRVKRKSYILLFQMNEESCLYITAYHLPGFYWCAVIFVVCSSSVCTRCSRQHDCTSKNSMVGPLQYIWRYKMIFSFYVYVLNNRKLGWTLPKIESTWTSLKTSILDAEAFVTEFKGEKNQRNVFNSLFAVRYQPYEEKQVK